MGFRENPDMGLKWVKSGFRPTFDPFLHLKTHFWAHFSPLTKTHLKPTLSANKLFSKKGPEAALTQHKGSLLNDSLDKRVRIDLPVPSPFTMHLACTTRISKSRMRQNKLSDQTIFIGCVIAQAFFSRGVFASFVKSRFFSAGLSVI